MTGDQLAASRAPIGSTVAKRKGGIPFILELPLLVLVALIVAIIIKTFVIQAFWIPSGSMIPTLEINDRVLVNKLEYRIQEPERGDVIVFDSPWRQDGDESLFDSAIRVISESLGIRTAIVPDDFIKRIVAVGGDTVLISDNRLSVNGVAVSEPYLPPGVQMPDFGPVTVPIGNLFVMGDNRNYSSDSRVFDTISTDSVVGRAFVRMWPLDRWAGL